MKKQSVGTFEKCHKIILEEDGTVGIYIHVWLTAQSEFPERDHLQDTWEIAFEQCEEDYDVPRTCFEDIK